MQVRRIWSSRLHDEAIGSLEKAALPANVDTSDAMKTYLDV